MFEMFYPDLMIRDTYKIDYEGFYELGFRSIIFDIDNTLVHHGAPANDKCIKLMKRLKNIGFDVLVLSNNKEPRVRTFAEACGIRYIYKAGKPSKKGYKRAMELLGTGTDNTLFIGDQIFTDVWGAKRCNIFSILVTPIHRKEEIQIVLKRRLEWFIIREYKKKRGISDGYIRKN